MKNSRFLISTILVLLGLLVFLGSLQYAWLGEIGSNQRENMQNRLNRDMRDFASAFNSEIRWAFFSFQLDPSDWLNRDWTVFNQRYADWKTKTSYPGLVKDIYFVGKNSAPLRYNAERQTFEETAATEELQKVQSLLAQNEKTRATDALVVDTFLLLTPNNSSGRESKIVENGIAVMEIDLSGYVVLKLDEQTVKNFLADLTEKYFPADGFADYSVTIFDNPELKAIYSNKELPAVRWENYDANIALLDLSNIGFNMIVNADVFSARTKAQKKEPPPVRVAPPVKFKESANDTVKVFRYDRQNEQTKELPARGNWTLSVRHQDGSLEQFIANTNRKNLAISFGILSILAVSIVLVFLSAHRAQILAQRQMDFVSGVSHEFRTPLAVIYSAGENLADGVIQEQTQIFRYGNLIKNEGRKLSQMVEQILEFAGARAGRGNYNFAETGAAEIIENALNECKPLLNEKDFTIEKNIAAGLPKIFADGNALSRAVQNLIVNSIKYDAGEKLIKISAFQNNGDVNIAIEDFGIGIAKKDLAKIFAPFYRAQTVVDAQIHGNGLGLSLVKQTVEAHGGKLKAESEIAQGSKFIISLPVREKLNRRK